MASGRLCHPLSGDPYLLILRSGVVPVDSGDGATATDSSIALRKVGESERLPFLNDESQGDALCRHCGNCPGVPLQLYGEVITLEPSVVDLAFCWTDAMRGFQIWAHNSIRK